MEVDFCPLKLVGTFTREKMGRLKKGIRRCKELWKAHNIHYPEHLIRMPLKDYSF